MIFLEVQKCWIIRVKEPLGRIYLLNDLRILRLSMVFNEF
jgi:hypothetical protein